MAMPRLMTLGSLAMIVLLAASACGGSETADDPVKEVGAADAVAMLDERVVVDVRTPEEYAAGHIAGALNIDVQAADFGARIEELEENEDYLVYCRSGRRSALAAEQMAEAGFTDIVDAGGLDALIEAGAPVE